MTHHNNPMSKKEITRLAMKGLSAEHIAGRVGTSPTRVRTFCKYHNIDYFRLRSIWTEETEALALRHYREGKSRHESSILLGCTRKALTAKLHSLKVKMKEARKAEPVTVIPFVSTDPPSTAMIRLAQFDSVVQRALRTRLGLLDEDKDD